MGDLLGVPYSKRLEIMQQSSTEREKSLALGDYWVNTAPDASWEVLARGLYHYGEERALAVMKQYLQQQGMSVFSCLVFPTTSFTLVSAAIVLKLIHEYCLPCLDPVYK